MLYSHLLAGVHTSYNTRQGKSVWGALMGAVQAPALFYFGKGELNIFP